MVNAIPFMALTLLLAACGQTNESAPSGQVIATVDGQEITLAELQLEMNGATSADPAQAKQAQADALRAIITRKILAHYAHDHKFDNSPRAAIIKQRAEQAVLAQMVQTQLVHNVPPPSRDEAQQYVSDHPATFSQRRLFVVDQVIASNVPKPVLDAMKPLETLDSIVSLLDQNHLHHNATVGVVDTVTIDPGAAQELATMAIGAVFIEPGQGSTVRISRIRDVQTRPILGEDAITLALDAVRSKRANAQVTQQIQSIIDTGMKDVKFNPAYK